MTAEAKSITTETRPTSLLEQVRGYVAAVYAAREAVYELLDELPVTATEDVRVRLIEPLVKGYSNKDLFFPSAMILQRTTKEQQFGYRLAITVALKGWWHTTELDGDEVVVKVGQK